MAHAKLNQVSLVIIKVIPIFTESKLVIRVHYQINSMYWIPNNTHQFIISIPITKSVPQS